MSVKLEQIIQVENSKSIEKYKKENIFSFNKDTQFKLIIKNYQKFQMKNDINKNFLNFVLSGDNNTYIINEISPKEVIQNIADKSIKNDIKNLTSQSFYKIFRESNHKIKAGDKSEYSINSEVIKLNITSPEKYSLKKGEVLLIKFNLTNL